MKKLLTLFAMFFTLNTANAQNSTFVFKANEKEFNLKSDFLELRLDNRKNLINSQGFLRAFFKDFSTYFDRQGLLNYQTGTEIGIGSVRGFSNYRRINRKTVNEEGNVISEIKNKIRSYDRGFEYNAKNFYDLRFGVERSSSNENLEGKVIFHVGGEALISTFNEQLEKTTDIVKVGNKFFYIKSFLNSFRVNEENNTETKNIFSVTPLEYFNYAYDGDHNGYFLGGSKYAYIFTDFDSSIVIGSANQKDHEIKKYEYKIENKNRLVDRLYDDKFKKFDRFVKDPFFYNGFRLEFKKDKKPRGIINFKYGSFFVAINTNKEYNVGVSHKRLIVGKDKNLIYVGFRWKK